MSVGHHKTMKTGFFKTVILYLLNLFNPLTGTAPSAPAHPPRSGG